jgi:uncharacterized protein (DUF952 family)
MIYHVTTLAEWEACLAKDSYVPNGFAKVGFVHACSLEQLNGVLERYFQGKTKLLLLEIEETELIPILKYEIATANELFPHIYGRINKSAVKAVKPVNC